MKKEQINKTDDDVTFFDDENEEETKGNVFSVTPIKKDGKDITRFTMSICFDADEEGV